MNDKNILITGSNGQLGKALQAKYPGAAAHDYDVLDITSMASLEAFNWADIKVILNAAAYTNVDGAETPEGRQAAWKVNATAVANLTKIAIAHDITVVHVSTDYVFDGTNTSHTETEEFSPLNVYGQTKAAGDIAVSINPKHYILRTSWVIGDGNNFVRTMIGLAQKDINPGVVSDQIGRLTFTSELVASMDHLLSTNAPFGTYNVSNTGNADSWANITREIFSLGGFKNTVSDVTTADYFANKPEAATRPLNSAFDLSKIQATGFKGTDWQISLKNYVDKELGK